MHFYPRLQDVPGMCRQYGVLYKTIFNAFFFQLWSDTERNQDLRGKTLCSLRQQMAWSVKSPTAILFPFTIGWASPTWQGLKDLHADIQPFLGWILFQFSYSVLCTPYSMFITEWGAQGWRMHIRWKWSQSHGARKQKPNPKHSNAGEYLLGSTHLSIAKPYTQGGWRHETYSFFSLGGGGPHRFAARLLQSE